METLSQFTIEDNSQSDEEMMMVEQCWADARVTEFDPDLEIPRLALVE